MGPDSNLRMDYVMSHLGVIRYFVLWGILESIVYIFTKGNRYKCLTIYMAIFFAISITVYIFPSLIVYV